MNQRALIVVMAFSSSLLIGCGAADTESEEIDSPELQELRECLTCPPTCPADDPCEQPGGGGTPGAGSSSSGGGNPAPDLAPIATGGTYCVKNPSGLVVKIKNFGTALAAANTTRVEFFPGGVVDSYVAALAAGATKQLVVPVPPACSGPGCTFRVAADDSGLVVETNEYNNYINDIACP